MSNTKLKAAGALLVVVVAFGAGLYLGIGSRLADFVSAQTGSSTPPTSTITILGPSSQPANVDLSQFWAAWNLLSQNFVETHASGTIPTDQQKIYGAIAGLTDSYGDPYTTFFPPAQATSFQQTLSGSFGGIGAQMDVDQNGSIIVTAPLKGSPAEAAGIEAGDIVTMIGTTSTQGMSVDEAVSLIRGSIGTKVTLTLARKGTATPIVVTITRQTINVPEINEYARPDGVYVIQLYEFTANSGDLFRNALRDYLQSGDTRLILDLRDNPGGYLDQAVQIASYFLPVGDTIVTEDFEGKQPNVVNRSLGYNVFAGKKLSMAILIDQGSASASEILSGALQQQGVAKLVGTRSFGKGSVQQVMDLGNGAQIKITVARWLTPNGTSISNGGLTPDINATTTADQIKAGKDPQMDAAAAWLITQ